MPQFTRTIPEPKGTVSYLNCWEKKQGCRGCIECIDLRHSRADHVSLAYDVIITLHICMYVCIYIYIYIYILNWVTAVYVHVIVVRSLSLYQPHL